MWQQLEMQHATRKKPKKTAPRYIRARLTPEIVEALGVLQRQEPSGTDEVTLATKLAHLGAAEVIFPKAKRA